MHCLNISLSCHGHSGWAGRLFCSYNALTLTLRMSTLDRINDYESSSILFAEHPSPHERFAVRPRQVPCLHAFLIPEVQSLQQRCEVHLQWQARQELQCVLHKASRVCACVLMAHSQRSASVVWPEGGKGEGLVDWKHWMKCGHEDLPSMEWKLGSKHWLAVDP